MSHIHAPLVALFLLLSGCSTAFAPQQPSEIFDALEQAGALQCMARAPVGERAEACTAPSGDLIAVVTEDPTRVIRETRVEFGGPWLAAPTWVIISADDDLEAMRALRDALGVGSLYLDIDEVPVQVD